VPYVLRSTLIRVGAKTLNNHPIHYQEVLNPVHDIQLQSVMRLNFGNSAVFGKLECPLLFQVHSRPER